MQPRMPRRKKLVGTGNSIMVLGLLGGLMLTLVGETNADARKNSQTFNYDFRGRPIPADVERVGLRADQLKVEAEGLRITLPNDTVQGAKHNFALPVTVAGDFEITATIEIITAKAAPASLNVYGVGVLMTITDGARIGRLTRARAKGGEVVTRDHWGQENGERKLLMGSSPCAEKVLRLRLKRTSTILQFLWAPGTEGDNFEGFYQYEYGANDVKEVRFSFNARAGATPNEQTPVLDVRIAGLQIGAGVVEPAASANEPAARQARSKTWFFAAVFITLGILFLALGIWLRRKLSAPPAAAVNEDKQPEPQAAAAPIAVYHDEKPEPQAAQPFVSFPCSGCGKSLKAKPELVGRKVKCPQCSTAVLVTESSGIP
jgi:DNA-directed RNA polymerase subunit RPC12/RpoP